MKWYNKETGKIEERTFEGLTVRPIEQFGVAFKHIKVPSGWRLPTLTEGIMLVNNPKFVKWSKFNGGKHDFYVIQPFIKNARKYAAWLGCGSGNFYIGTCDNLGGYNAARGVLFIKK